MRDMRRLTRPPRVTSLTGPTVPVASDTFEPLSLDTGPTAVAAAAADGSRSAPPQSPSQPDRARAAASPGRSHRGRAALELDALVERGEPDDPLQPPRV